MSCSETFPFFGSRRGDDVLAKTMALIKPEDPHSANPKDVIDRLYSILNILDGKANGLLRVNSLFIALLLGFISLAFGNSEFRGSIPRSLFVAAEICLPLLLVSSILCLFVVRVNWKFLRNAKLDVTRKYDFSGELDRLAKIVNNRTHYYWIAWYGTFFGLLMPIIVWMFF